MVRWHWLVVGLLTWILGPGCGRHVPVPAKGRSEDQSPAGTDKARPSKGQSHTARKPPADSEPARPNPAVRATKEEGILRGRVRWQGKGPELPGTDAKTRGIANVVVWLENAPGGEAEDTPEDRVLSQRDGDFHPHILLARKGDRLRMVSADEKANFRATGRLRFDLPLSRGQQAFRTLGDTGLATVSSQIQPRASAYLWVFDHKYYTRTGADGRFRLPAVPAGTYQIVFWHEGKRPIDPLRDVSRPPLRQRVTVAIGKNEGSVIEWTLSSEEVARK
jgi:hypothetical protein